MKFKFSTFTLLLLGLTSSSVAFAALPEETNTEVKRYIEQLNSSTDLDVRQGITFAKGFINEKDEVKAKLVDTKGDPKIQLRVAAGYALTQLGEEDESFILEQLLSPHANEAFFDQIFSLLPDEDEIKILKKHLSNKSANTGAALAYLSRQRGTLFDLFKEQLLDESTSKSATTYAIRNRDLRFLPTVQSMIDSGNADLQKNAFAILSSISHIPGAWNSIKPILIKALKSNQKNIQQEAAKLLAEHQERDVIPTIIELTKTAEPSDKPSLLALLSDNQLYTSKSQMEPFLKDENDSVKQEAYKISANDPQVTEEIMKMVRSTNFSERLIGLNAAGHTRSKAAANYLVKSLFEARPDVRQISARGLALLKEPSTLPALKQALSREKNLEIKEDVIRGIGGIGNQDAVTLLHFNSRDKDPKVRQAIAQALGLSNHPKALAPLQTLVKDRNRDVQWVAFVNLLKIQPNEAKKHFEQAFRNPKEGFILDIDQLPENSRKLVYEYLLTENKGRARDEALAQILSTGEYPNQLANLAMSDVLLPKVRRKLLNFLADRGDRRDLMILDNIARTSKNDDISRYATWMLLRNPKPQEATFRRFLLGQDDAKKAIATYGLALNHKIDPTKKKTKSRRRRKKK